MKPIISKNIRIRCPNHFLVGENSVVDDFCYFSTRIRVGRCSHIASGCSIGGGKKHLFVLGDYSSLSSGVKIWCSSDNFTNDVVTLIPSGLGKIKSSLIEGGVIIGNMTAVGANTVIMPANHIPEGTVIGALSFVPAGFKFKPWSVYTGIPIKFIKKRNRKNVLAQVKQIERGLKKIKSNKIQKD